MSTAAVSPDPQRPHRVRVVSAASLFDGHDAAINIMRRILQAQGAEVIHLGHDRSVEEIVTAAIQEDAHAVAVSSYQGGHLEFFRYLVDRLGALGAGHIKVFGGGGGTIIPEEIEELHAYGVERIFSPEDGRRLGLEGMIRSMLDLCESAASSPPTDEPERLTPEDPLAVARLISRLEIARSEDASGAAELCARLESGRQGDPAPVLGFTGTGGAGKSSVLDEIVRRFRIEHPDRSVGLLLIDPTRRRSGGALLADRIRMNAIHGPRVYVRSLATRQAHLALSQAVRDAVAVLQAAHFDLILVETAGIGQSDSEIVDLADASVYVMTPEYGAPSQLEKIDMLDLADVVVLNKFDRRGAADALRDVRKQWRRNHADFGRPDEEIPVFPTVASQWNDPGMDRLYAALRDSMGVGSTGDAAALASVEVGEAAPLTRELVIDIHKMALHKLPKFEMYEEGRQIRKSSKSVKSMIVEGYGRRRYKQDFIRFLTYALASNDETMDHLETLFDTESLTDKKLFESLRDRVDLLGRKLNLFLQSVEREHMSEK